MIGLLLVAIGVMFEETGSSMGKYEVARKKESLYAMGFLSIFWGIIVLLGIGWYRYDELTFSFASLPTLIPRVFLEIILFFITLHAILQADRSTFTFLRIWTLPLLILADIMFGYSISNSQIIGIMFIIFAFIFLSAHHGFSKKGRLLSFISAVLAVATISLYKYDITYFNSVEIEQIIMGLSILFVLFLTAWIRDRENLFRYLSQPLFLLQSLCAGIGSVVINFAYLFNAASIITTIKRSFSMLVAIVAGKQYFNEKKIGVKLGAFLLISFGLVVMLF